MANLRAIAVVLFVFITNFINAQIQIRSFYIEINDNNYIPILDASSNRYFVDSSLTDSQAINNLFGTLDVYDSVYVNDIDINESKNLVIISTFLTDQTILINALNSLVNDYSYFADYIEIESFELLNTPFTPSDYESSSGIALFDQSQHDLNMIRAQEAWGITNGDPNVLVGIADTGFHVHHPDLVNEIVGGIGNYDTGPNSPTNPEQSKHGTVVAGRASAQTNNEPKSISAIGFNTKMIVSSSYNLANLKLLSDLGAKVVNASFGSDVPFVPNVTNQYVEQMINNGTVVVAAAGNGIRSGGSSNTSGVYSNESYASRFYLPASYRNVISVSTVGERNDIGSTAVPYDNWKDVHLIATSTAYPNGTEYSQSSIPFNETELSWQHNDSIDIVVPSYFGSPSVFSSPYEVDHYRNLGMQGTSFSAPIVAGTVGLMFSVNHCIDPKEVETILKLTAVKIDNIPENLQFYGKLGAGRLDAYEAVKMSKDMYEPFGTVEVKDRILYRPWFYKLVTAPYEIKMSNNDVTGGSKIKFRARNNIEIVSGDYYPLTGGYIDLQIDSTIAADCPPLTGLSASRLANTKPEVKKEAYKIYPTLVNKEIEVSSITNSINDITEIKVYDFYGIEVVSQEKFNNDKLLLNLESLNEGIYIVRIFDNLGKILHTQKIVKK